MKKRVLAISASPRKGGNSDLLCDRFLEGTAEAGHSAEKIYLHRERLGYCTACYSCRETKRCVLNDAGNDILARMVEADVIVFSTPVYFYAISGQLKTLIDRTLPRFGELEGAAYLIATAASPTEDALEGALSDYRNFLRMTPGLRDAGHIFGLNAWAMGDIAGNPALGEAYAAGREI